MESWRFVLSRVVGTLWVRAAVYAVLAVAAALLAAVFSPLVPQALAKPFGGGTVNGLLDMLASSLLAVATFSVAAMLTAYTNVSQSATPRAAALITGDRQAQGALATFVGAFLYSAVAYSALGTGYYAGGGRAILFGVTLAVMALVAVTLLRWLDQLLSLARVSHAILQVEKATNTALHSRFGPGAQPACDPAPDDCAAVEAGEVGYVQNVDVGRLETLAEAHDLHIWVEMPPGAFADSRRALARVQGAMSARTQAAVRAAFALGEARSFSQDPRFGLVVLGQVASRALSPGINDPGTAIDVVGAAVRLLTRWIDREARRPDAPPRRVRIRAPAFADALDDVFTPVARDGASALPVALRLQRALSALGRVAQGNDAQTLLAFAREALARSEAAIDFAPDLERLRKACDAAPQSGSDSSGDAPPTGT